jgi:hypothetical protein
MSYLIALVALHISRVSWLGSSVFFTALAPFNAYLQASQRKTLKFSFSGLCVLVNFKINKGEVAFDVNLALSKSRKFVLEV